MLGLYLQQNTGPSLI